MAATSVFVKIVEENVGCKYYGYGGLSGDDIQEFISSVVKETIQTIEEGFNNYPNPHYLYSKEQVVKNIKALLT